MQKKKGITENKRILAWLLIACLILSDQSFISAEVKAEEGTQTSAIVACTLTPKVKVGGKEYTIPDNYISVKDADNKPVEVNSDNKYELKAGADYRCVIKGKEMEEHTVDFKAPAGDGNIDIMGDAGKIRLVYDALDTLCVGETRTPVNELGIAWTWESDNSSILSVDSNGVVTGRTNGTATVTRTSSTASLEEKPLTNQKKNKYNWRK